MRLLFSVALLLFSLLSSVEAFSQISIKQYKQSEEQTFYINTDSASQKFNARSLKKPLKTSPQSTYTWYKYNQLFTSQGGYDGRVLNGEFSASYKNNNLKIKGQYLKGLKVGTWYEWNPDGKLKEVSNWKKGLKYGTSYSYENGAIVKASKYKNNLLNGKTIRYAGGKPETEYYKNGNQLPKAPEPAPKAVAAAPAPVAKAESSKPKTLPSPAAPDKKSAPKPVKASKKKTKPTSQKNGK